MFVGQLSAQELTADILVRDAVAEFISSDDVPRFVVRGLRVQGEVDSIFAVVHPSAVRTIDGAIRYKPHVERIERIGDAVLVHMILVGKHIPLPEESVRGGVRLSLRAKGTVRGQRVSIETPRFDVSVANVPIPKPAIAVADVSVDKILGGRDRHFSIHGIYVRAPVLPPVDDVDDIREVVVDTVVATIISFSYDVTVSGKGRKLIIARQPYRREDGTWSMDFRIDGGGPLRSGMFQGNAIIEISAQLRHRNTIGPARSKTIPIVILS